MKILVEGERYSLELLRNIFSDSKFYHQKDREGIITSVGYYHSYDNGELVYMLPKVFMADEQLTIFGVTKTELYDIGGSAAFKHKSEYNWVRQTIVYFYNSLLEFRRRNQDSNFIQSSLAINLDKKSGIQEYSYLDLLLSFVNFYKKNKNQIIFKSLEFDSNKARNVKWEKTIRKSVPLLTSNKQPLYNKLKNKKSIIDREEELLIYFFSIINHFDKEHKLYLNLDKSFPLLTGDKFEKLKVRGLSKLKKIKYKYFNDTLKRMYHLCEIYFSKTDKSSSKKKNEEFISVSHYNIVFEDMVDKLFSESIEENRIDEESINKLKHNDDGKIIDHIFDYQSLFDTSNIFYIGDSKYYKSGSTAGKLSKYKQFTYAKNIIQYNIDLLNRTGGYSNDKIRYRDELTEGYNITPNFFIYGYIEDYKNFEYPLLKEKGDIIKSYHFENRLFDRDTLFVHQYSINFLYVLKMYSSSTASKMIEFRSRTKKKFRDNFVDFFSDSEKSKFDLFKYNKADFKEFIDKNFRQINGKCFVTFDNELLLAKYHDDNSLEDILKDFENYEFSD